MTNQCACTRPSGDAFLCQICADELGQALSEVPFLDRQLDLVITRQTVYVSPSDGGRSSTTPLPFHVAASKTKHTISRVLERWSKALITDSCPASARPEHTSSFLLARLESIRNHAEANQIFATIRAPIDDARRLIDRPPDRWYAGPCNNEVDNRECGTELYARTGALLVECKTCKAKFDVKARREWLLQAAEDHLANAATLARAVSWLGEEPVTPHRIGMWVKRKRLIARGSEPYGDTKHPDRTRPLYRVGDVIDLLAESNRKDKSA